MGYTSPSCAKEEEVLGGTQCAVQWKTWEFTTHLLLHVYMNGENHLRDEACTGAHRVPITSEVRQFVTRMDACGMQARHIWSNLRRAPDVPSPPLGLPSRRQITDCVKRLRKKNLTRNTRQGVKSLAEEFPYYDGIDAEKAFLFAPEFEDDGFPRIGKESDADPFVIEITCLSLLTKINQLCGGDNHFRLFHTDATFKLSDLGYPVITCGFTDRSRTYHLAAILIVGARTHREYELAFGSFAKLYQRIFGASLREDAIMGDAEYAQLNALRNVTVFSESKYLMCFFHVLYNVHKRTRHLNTGQGVAVFSGIMDMHFTTNYIEYCSVRDRIISEWRMEPSLNNFADYFEEQWIESRFWRWQIYHSPSSYATTNNPCKVFNSCVKRHVQRKTSEICALIRSMITLAEDVGCDVSSLSASIAAPNPEIKRTAKWMLKAKAVMVTRTRDAAQVRVLHISEVHIDAEAMATMREMANATIGDQESQHFPFLPLMLNKSQKRRASRLYCGSVKWSTRRAHRVNMPRDGWLVNAEENNCEITKREMVQYCMSKILSTYLDVIELRSGLAVRMTFCLAYRRPAK